MRILVTGFEAFGGHGENPTEKIIALLPERMGDCEIVTLLLPVEFERAGRMIVETIDNLRPDAVLSLGLAASREAISVERLAVNLMDARIPDNSGAQPVDAPIVPGAPNAYFATVSPRRVRDTIAANGDAAVLSATAGLYVCNAVYYTVLHHETESKYAYNALFIHVPLIEADELVKPVKSSLYEIIRIINEHELIA